MIETVSPTRPLAEIEAEIVQLEDKIDVRQEAG
jgi:hypothetical protein